MVAKYVQISDHIRGTDQRFIYAYDFLHMWLFMVELIQAGEAETGMEYPRVVMSMGTAPDEHSKEEDPGAGILEEEDPYAMESDERYDADADSEQGDDDEGGFDHGNIDDLGDEFR